VNNVEADHLECYGTLAMLEDAFRTFAGHARRVLVGADDGGARRVAERLETPVWRVGLASDADVRVRDVRARVDATLARVAVPGGEEHELRLRVPGVHNVRNAAMAIGVAAALEAPLPPVLEALAAFTGVGRRFELVGDAAGVTVVDDYAHHPTEVAVTLAAARQRYPSNRLVAVFQPHLYSRTAELGEGLGIALAVADVAVVTEIYAAREQPMPGVTGERVLDAARRAGAETVWVRDRDRVAAEVAALVRRGDVVLTLGAGDITRVGPELLGLLRERAA
jgi:UDP-N-acetylmuramate--alanine ligase